MPFSDHAVIFSGSAMRDFTARVCAYIGVKPGEATVEPFSDEEPNVQLHENVRDRTTYIISSTFSASALLELCAMADAVRRANGHAVAVIPYFGFARQDRKDKPRVPITGKLACNFLVVSGVEHVMTMDLHAPQIQGFLDIAVEHLFASLVTPWEIKNPGIPNLKVVAPDVGALNMARAYARWLSDDGETEEEVEIAVIEKRRKKGQKAKVIRVIGDVSGSNCLLTDDIGASCGTLSEAADALRKNGAKKDMYAALTHGVFSPADPTKGRPDALETLAAAGFKHVWVTNSIPWRRSTPPPDWLHIVDIAPFFAEAIYRDASRDSISALFDRLFVPSPRGPLAA